MLSNIWRFLIMAFTVTKDTIIGDVLDADFSVAPLFLEIGMHCLGCPSSRGESIQQACDVHGTDADELVQKLNDHFAQK
jgi:hybrid cluster-associated redox disulfide protein